MSDFAVIGLLIVGLLLSMVCWLLAREIEVLEIVVSDLRMKVHLLELDNKLDKKFGDK